MYKVPGGSDPIVWNLGIRPDLKDAFETYVRTKLGTEESRVAAATEFERACAQRRASEAAQAGGEKDDEGEAPIVTEPTEEMSCVNAPTLCTALQGHVQVPRERTYGRVRDVVESIVSSGLRTPSSACRSAKMLGSA